MRGSEVFAYLFDVGKDILCTTLDLATGVLSAQTGDSTTQTPDVDRAEWWQHTGFSSRPTVPSPGNAACQSIVLKRSDRDIILATRDVRGTDILGNLADGETCVYASGAQGRSVYKADGSINHITTDSNKPDGNSVFIRVGPKELRGYSPNVGFWGDATGWHFRTWQGCKFDMTGLGLPAPFNALGLNSSIMLTADSITLDAAVLSLGRIGASGIAQPVVQATPLAADMALLSTALSDVSTVLGDLVTLLATGTNSGGLVVFTGLTALGAEVTTASTAIKAAKAKLALIATAVASGGTATNTSIA